MSTMRDAPILKAVADVIKTQIDKAFGVLRGRTDKIEARVKQLEIEGTVKALHAVGTPSTSDLIDFRVGEVGKRIDGLEEQVKSLPKPERGEKGDSGERGGPGPIGPAGKDGDKGEPGTNGSNGKDAPPLDTAAIIQAVVAKIPVPKDGKDGQSIQGDPGQNGKDAPPVDEEALAAKVLAKIPVPQNGKDGINGKDAPLIDTKALADQVTQKVLGQIPPPVNGKDAPPIDTKALTDEIVETVRKQIPTPINGKDGRDGKDAEQLDVNDIVSKILGQIPPPIPGKDGKDVDPEAINVRIVSEVSKAVAALPKPAAGRDGRDGRAGEPGEPGKAAADIDFLEGIDESASYQRGVFAHYRNGIWQAYRTTDPVIDKDYAAAGWRCLVPGIVDMVESLAQDRRTIIRSTELSDGQLITTKTKSLALLDQGVWKEGLTYEQGDSVTVAGSLWIAQEITQDRPGISKAWRLAVKRGSDGKDLRPRDENDLPLNGKGSVYLGAKR